MDFNVEEKVKEYYGNIASKVTESAKCSCSCDKISNSIYEGADLNSLPKEAINASLGCANPLVFAELKEGEVVLDLGSGGGIDVLMSSKFVGENGKIYGLDMTDEMLNLANKNKEKMGVKNVEFIKGYIENIPLPAESVDVVISNCVINLSENKEKALFEAYRVLKKGGRLAIADIVSLKEIAPELKKQAELWAGCIAGTISVEKYTNILQNLTFKNISIDPVNVYTKDVIQSLMEDKRILTALEDIDLDSVDSAFAGSHIKAIK